MPFLWTEGRGEATSNSTQGLCSGVALVVLGVHIQYQESNQIRLIQSKCFNTYALLSPRNWQRKQYKFSSGPEHPERIIHKPIFHTFLIKNVGKSVGPQAHPESKMPTFQKQRIDGCGGFSLQAEHLGGFHSQMPSPCQPHHTKIPVLYKVLG